jgi:hypothetical protein
MTHGLLIDPDHVCWRLYFLSKYWICNEYVITRPRERKKKKVKQHTEFSIAQRLGNLAKNQDKKKLNP